MLVECFLIHNWLPPPAAEVVGLRPTSIDGVSLAIWRMMINFPKATNPGVLGALSFVLKNQAEAEVGAAQ
jgi:hypothetical protein